VSVPVLFREAEVEALFQAYANAYRAHHLLAFIQITRPQQLPTKTTRQLSFGGKKTTSSTRPGLAFPRHGLPRITLALESQPRASKEASARLGQTLRAGTFTIEMVGQGHGTVFTVGDGEA